MKTRQNDLFIPIIVIFLLLAHIASAKEGALSGKLLNNKKYKEIHLKNLEEKTLETVKIDANGTFSFKKKFSKTNFYVITLDKQAQVLFFSSPGEKAQVIIDTKNVREPVFTNSPESQRFYTYQNKLLASRQNPAAGVQLVKSMIDEDTDSPAGLFFITFLDKERHLNYYEKLANGLKKYAHIPAVQSYIKTVDGYTRVQIGKEAPEIALKNPEGKEIKLSSLRGKYVLIDFWASWCGPCRRENPNNVELYKKYHDKGFEIYAVSMDKSKESWEKAIKDDHLSWIHVSDLQGWRSSAGKTYGVSGIPYTVLLDKEGKIMAFNLRGAGLKKKLKNIFDEQ